MASIGTDAMVACIHPAMPPRDYAAASYAPIVNDLAAALELDFNFASAICPAMDCDAFLMSNMADGLLERYPKLRLAFLHSGTAWLPLALDKIETALWLCNQQFPVSLEPDRIFFNRSTMVSFELGDSTLVRMAGGLQKVAAWGSGSTTYTASSVTDMIAELEQGAIPSRTIERFMSGNAGSMFGLTKW